MIMTSRLLAIQFFRGLMVVFEFGLWMVLQVGGILYKISIWV